MAPSCPGQEGPLRKTEVVVEDHQRSEVTTMFSWPPSLVVGAVVVVVLSRAVVKSVSAFSKLLFCGNLNSSFLALKYGTTVPSKL